MGERKIDKSLYIRTTGFREWKDPNSPYNRCESTPYTALDKLFESYKIKRTDKVVDFGAGRGRVAFYIHNRFQVPVKGIEVNDITYEEAITNKKRYRQKMKHINAPIKFKYGLAEDYDIKEWDNKFYFFNPFSIEIFKKVVNNILESIKKNDRVVDIILYYPLDEYKEFLKTITQFNLINKVEAPKTGDHKEKFLIYRYRPEKV